jgi:hypothetical protein
VLAKGWIPACELRIGDVLVGHDGKLTPVDGVADSGLVLTVYNVEVEKDHTYFVGGPTWGFDVWVHNLNYKQGGKLTEPTLPPTEVVNTNGVKVMHYFRGNDHAPPHLHVYGKGPNTKIGANGKPIAGEAELSAAQRAVVEGNLSKIRAAGNKIRKWMWFWAQPG